MISAEIKIVVRVSSHLGGSWGSCSILGRGVLAATQETAGFWLCLTEATSSFYLLISQILHFLYILSKCPSFIYVLLSFVIDLSRRYCPPSISHSPTFAADIRITVSEPLWMSWQADVDKPRQGCHVFFETLLALQAPQWTPPPPHTHTQSG